jgi:PAS domain S-box-containing protein
VVVGFPGWAYAVMSILATTSIALILRSRRRADHVRADAREWAEERFRGLVEQLPVTVYIDAVDSLSTALYISPQYEQLTGYPSELRESTPDFWVDHLLHPDDRDQILEESLRTNATGDPFDVEYRIVRKDGSVRWVHDNAVLVDGPGGETVWQGILVDITERKLAEQALHEAEERFRAIVEHMPGAIYLDHADSAMQPVYVSPQIERITGMTPDEWMASTDAWVDLVHPDDRGRVVDGYLAAMRTRRPWAAEYRMIRRDGRTIWVQDETTFLRDRLDRELVQGVIFDVTEQKLAEQALRDSERREREAAERLRALDEMKNTFLAAVSHELRSPLTSILGLSLTLERGSAISDADRSDLLQRLSANARKLDRLLEDLLDIDRLNRGIVTPNYRTTDIGALARRTYESLELGDRRVEVRTDAVVMDVDPAKVERIVENLLTNAVRHTPTDACIWLEIAHRDGGVLIRVDDDGPGVPQDLREVIFEPFRQGPSASSHSPGTGVGLSLVSRFAALHGGRAWVQERPGGGASFNVFLPAPDSVQPDGPFGALRRNIADRPAAEVG